MELKDNSNSFPKCANTPRERPTAKSLQTRLMHLGAVMAMILLSGCASTSLHGDTDPWKYNPDSGYPGAGGPRWVSW